MGEHMRRFDWSGTALGPVEDWPASLKTAVSLLLRARQPMYIGWGPDLLSIYNDGYIPICGTKHPGALGRPMSDVWAEEWEKLLPLNVAVLGGESFWLENEPFLLKGRADEELSYFSFSYTPLLDDDGRVGGIFCSAIETTSAIRLAQNVDAELRRQHQMFQQAPGFIVTMRGPDHVVEFVNDAHVRLFGSYHWPGKPVRTAFPDIEGQGFFEMLDQVYCTGERILFNGAPVRYRPGPGNEEVVRHLDFIFAPIVDDTGAVAGIFCEGQDVTEALAARNAQQALQQELEQSAAALTEANRRQSEFLATLAHELRNPLAPIRSALAAIRRSDGDVAVDARMRDVLDRQVAVMSRLIDDLIDIARITGGKLELRRQDTDLKQILEQAVETSLPLIQQRRHALRLDVPDTALPVNADPVRMSQVVSNLLNNAAKYTPEGGVITLSARAEGSEAIVEIADTGIGLHADALATVFQMFAQVSGGTPAGQTGLGIGLALVKQLVDLHDGSVIAESDGIGFGARFRVSIPSGHKALTDLVTVTACGAPGLEARPLRIVVVDDNQDGADTLSTLLQIMGHQVHVAYDGADGIMLVRQALPDVAFLDIGMPQMDGYEVARALRSDASNAQTLLVALTGWGTDEDRARAIDAGFDFHLTKPVGPAEVEDLLASVQLQRSVEPERTLP